MPTPEEMAQVLGGLPPNPDINEPLAPTEAGAQAVSDFAKSQAQRVAHLLMTPGDVYQGNTSLEEAKDWGPEMAMTMAGRMAAPESGAAGIFGGRLARTADLSALKVAEDARAQGYHPEVVRSSTGWHMGPEGKWKFEIPDTGVTALPTYSMTGNLKRTIGNVVEHPALFEAYPDLKNRPIQWGHDYGQAHYQPPIKDEIETFWT